MRKFFLFWFSLGAGLAIFWLVTKQIGWADIAQVLSLFQHWQGIVIFLITFLIAALHTGRWQFILRTQGYNLSFLKLGEIWLIGFMASYITPIALFGGEMLMSLGLKKQFGLPWPKNIASIAILKILNLSILLLFLILGIFSFLVLVGVPPENIFLLAAVTILSLGSVLSFFYYRSFRNKSLIRWLSGFLERRFHLNSQKALETEKEIFDFFNYRDKKIWQGLGLALLAFLLNLGRFWFIILFLKGEIINIFQTAAIFAFGHLAYVFPFPATLGSLEVSQVFVLNALGLESGLGPAFSLVLRGAELSLTLTGVLFLVKLGLKRETKTKI